MSRSPRAPAPSLTYDKQRLRLWLRMLRVTHSIEAELRERLRIEFETTLPRFDVMAALFRYPTGLTMTALSRQLLVSNGNVTGIIERLVGDGLVVRVAVDGDRRATMVRLTPQGTARFEAMAAAHARWIEELLGAVPAGLIPGVIDALDATSVHHLADLAEPMET